ncbi:hypothetical protein LSUE1_G006292 [Lachnellula suecica]|uniref:Aminoglycoside phosphotransferase domain-containing protein n=1 Tax=Lachnellula suecica TaxID=602035 RepID=A0A8T9C5S4_9HELO|nr:hypothetical protein LSUE1_G006292 [Lachnellula suecica]
MKKILGFTFVRWGSLPWTEHSGTSDLILPLDTSKIPYYAGATLETPAISLSYRDKSWKTWHLRKFAYGWAWIQGIKHKNVSPMARRHTSVIWAPFPMVMKYGTHINLSEAASLRFIAANASIPVPKVYCAVEHWGMKFILMEAVRGKTLGEHWQTASASSRIHLRMKLKEQFEELRNIPHPRPGAVCSSDIGPLFDRRIEDDIRGIGPFANEKDFSNFLRCGATGVEDIKDKATRFSSAAAQQEIPLMIGNQDKEGRKICFTHGDAHSGNFLVRGQEIVAWIDVEFAGFLPEHWEYINAMSSNDEPWWKQEIGFVLKQYPEELRAENARSTYFDDQIRAVLPREVGEMNVKVAPQ